MKLLSLASVLTLSLTASVAAADAPAACKPTGDVSFEIDHTISKPQTTTLKIYANGAWTYESTDKNGAAGPSGGSCLDPKTSTEVNDLVKSATWNATPVIHCMARNAESTTYVSNGKKLFTEMMCNSVKLDDKSAKALDRLKAIAATLQPAAKP
jgi:hypothetical protein